MLIEVIGMPWGSMPCGGFQEAKNRPCLGYQPETEGAKPRTPLFKISNNLLILGEELSEVREIEKPGNLGQTGFPRVLVQSKEENQSEEVQEEAEGNTAGAEENVRLEAGSHH